MCYSVFSSEWKRQKIVPYLVELTFYCGRRDRGTINKINSQWYALLDSNKCWGEGEKSRERGKALDRDTSCNRWHLKTWREWKWGSWLGRWLGDVNSRKGHTWKLLRAWSTGMVGLEGRSPESSRRWGTEWMRSQPYKQVGLCMNPSWGLWLLLWVKWELFWAEEWQDPTCNLTANVLETRWWRRGQRQGNLSGGYCNKTG